MEEKKEQELKKASVTISMKDELLSKTEVNGNQIVWNPDISFQFSIFNIDERR